MNDLNLLKRNILLFKISNSLLQRKIFELSFSGSNILYSKEALEKVKNSHHH